MTAKLSDLRVFTTYDNPCELLYRPVSVADLLAMLEAEGVLRRQWRRHKYNGTKDEYFLRTDWLPT